jgi:hypothetical protein
VLVDGVPATSVLLTCSLQLDGFTHDVPDAVSVSGAGPGVATVPPTVVSYRAEDEDFEVLCTSLVAGTAAGPVTLYWDDLAARWSTDPAATCSRFAGHGELPRPFEPIGTFVDRVVCRALAAVFPPYGDVPGIWDCPPYAATR